MPLYRRTEQSERPQGTQSEAGGPGCQDQPRTGGFRISGEPWEALEPLITEYVNTHRFGGRPRVPGRTGANPTGRGKGGVKRSLLAEAQGIPAGLAVDGANRHGMKLVRATLASVSAARPESTLEQPQGMCLDKGYDFDEVRRTFGRVRLYRPHPQPRRGSQSHQQGSWV